MDLKIPYANITDKKKAYDAAKSHVNQSIEKFGVKADVKYDDTNLKVDAKGKGFSAFIAFEDDYVSVSLDLSFLLKPLKGKILETLEKQFKKVI